ncbi:PAS domain-containing protein [Streptomyces rhizosphaerihabitans]|uniref:PAS domain-containing protein n=1 Tax=Streptomyces rhizosphaerihabitans TaxID=1266770 RepID=UPI0021C1C657|nr:PAS domain-containing protein [Streptomyces rhizosphaerihabitans]MCT9010276.1 PAS domain-containing protein [Streptomyces rhizosphaerihabitans]
MEDLAMAPDDALLVIDAAGLIVGWSQEARFLFERGTCLTVGRPVVELLTAVWTPAGAGPDRRSDRTAAIPGLAVKPVTLRDGRSGWGVYLLRPEEQGADARGQALLTALFTQSPIGMQVLDPDLRVLRVNTAAAGMSAFESTDVLGHRLSDVIHLSDPEETVAMLHDVLATGEPALDRLVRGRPPNDPAHEHVYSVSLFRLQDADGRVLGVSTAVVDVTGRERVLAHARVLNDVRERLGHTLELDTTCGELVDVLVPAFADAAEVDLLDPVVRGEDPPPGPVGPAIPLRRMSFASADPQRHSLGTGTGPFRFPGAWLQSLTDLRPQLITYQPDEIPDHHPQASRAQGSPGPHSAIVTPMTLRNDVLGDGQKNRLEIKIGGDDGDVLVRGVDEVAVAAADVVLGVGKPLDEGVGSDVEAGALQGLVPAVGSGELAEPGVPVSGAAGGQSVACSQTPREHRRADRPRASTPPRLQRSCDFDAARPVRRYRMARVSPPAVSTAHRPTHACQAAVEARLRPRK